MEPDRAFHRLTVRGGGGGGPAPEPWEAYPTAPRYTLPEPRALQMPLGEALKRRRSFRAFGPRSRLSIQDLSTLLGHAFGITGEKWGIPLRAYPSAGALYPLEIYLFAFRVDGLPSGIFHYEVRDHALAHLVEGALQEPLFHASWDQEAVLYAPATVMITAVYERTRVKYGYRAYRYIHMDAGAACQNLYLVAEALGLGTVLIGAFDDDALAALAGLDPDQEFPLALMPVGPRQG